MERVEQTRLTRTVSWWWLGGVFVAYAASLWILDKGLPLDHPLEDLFFDSSCTARDSRACWMFNKNDAFWTLALHEIPRQFFIGLGVSCALFFAASYKWTKLKPWREVAGTGVIGIGIVSAIVALLKAKTGHFCPGELDAYNGLMQKLIEAGNKPRCFPAGHPSPAFGMMVVFFGNVPRFWRMAGLYAGLFCGGTLSLIQMARGEHFLSHNIGTALTAMMVGACVYFFNGKFRRVFPA